VPPAGVLVSAYEIVWQGVAAEVHEFEVLLPVVATYVVTGPVADAGVDANRPVASAPNMKVSVATADTIIRDDFIHSP
jgi:hypothetical protein